MARTLDQVDAALAALEATYAADNTPTRVELANSQAKLYQVWNKTADSFRAWSTGSADYITNDPPGQNGRAGWYPLYDNAGLISWQPCPAAIRAEAVQLRVERRNITSGTVHTIGLEDSGKTLILAGPGATSTVTCRLPNAAPTGFCVNFIQEGSGGPRVTFVGGNNAAGEAATLLHRASAFRMAGQYALVTAMVITRTSGTRSTYVLGGDLIV